MLCTLYILRLSVFDILRLLLTGPRRWMWRRTIGRFRSEEALYKSAERQYQTLAETLDGQVSLSSGSGISSWLLLGYFASGDEDCTLLDHHTNTRSKDIISGVLELTMCTCMF